MLEIKGLVKRFGSFTALNGLDMTVEKGSVFGFAGPNGAGKTTTIKIMGGLLRADGGSIFADGSDITKDICSIRTRIGYMPDFFGVYDDLKVSEYMDFYEGAYYIPYSERKAITDRLMDMVNLTDKRNTYVDSLSRGMKQRLCLARSLVHDPDILILDEPASGLDPLARMEMKNILRRLGEEGKTIIISSHILPELAQMCTHLGIISHGRMLTQGTVDEILSISASKRKIEVSVINGVSDLCTVLRENGLCGGIADNENIVEFTFGGDDKQLSALLGDIMAAGIPVTAFGEIKNDIEDVFAKIAGGDEENA